MDIWFWVWLATAVIFSVAEIMTAGFFMLPFGIGAAITAVLAYFGVGLAWQWVVFIGVSTLLLFSLRRFSDRMTHEPPRLYAGDRLIGREGIVIETVDNTLKTGRVRVDREEWVADSASDAPIEPSQHIRVVRVDGAHLIVEPAGQPSADNQ